MPSKFREYKEKKARKKAAKLDNKLEHAKDDLATLRGRLDQLRQRMDMTGYPANFDRLCQDVDSCVDSGDISAAKETLKTLQTALEEAERVIDDDFKKIRDYEDYVQKQRVVRDDLVKRIREFDANGAAQPAIDADDKNRARVAEVQQDIRTCEAEQIRRCEAFLAKHHGKPYRGEVDAILAPTLVSFSQDFDKAQYAQWVRGSDDKNSHLIGKKNVLGKKLSHENAAVREARRRYAEKYNLSDAELLAVRVYTAQNYTFINPALANQKDKPATFDAKTGEYNADELDLYKVLATKQGAEQAEMAKDLAMYKKKGWLDDQNRLNFEKMLEQEQRAKLKSKDSGEGSQREEFAAAVKKYKKKDWMDSMQRPEPSKDTELRKKGWLNAKGQLDPSLGKTPQEVAEIEEEAAKYLQQQTEYDEIKNSMHQEGALHAGMMMEAFKKLPVWTGTLYRGQRMNWARFQSTYAVGKETGYEAFASMAATEYTARKFANGTSDTPLPADSTVSVLITAEIGNGRDLREIGVLGALEDEILVMPGTKLVVERIEESPTGDAGNPPFATKWMNVFMKQV